MTIEWNNIAISIFSTATIVGALGFILKKSFEKLLDNRLTLAQEQYKADLAESQRRQAEIFNKRFDALKTAVSLVYRARNVARELSKNATKENIQGNLRHLDDRDRFKSLRAYHDAIEELLFEERSIMPAAAFKMLHDQKNAIQYFINSIEHLSRLNRRDSEPRQEQAHLNERIQGDIEDAFFRLDKGYQHFVTVSQEFMGLESNNG